MRAVDVSSADAGLGTSAYFNDTESFTGNSDSFDLDLTVDTVQCRHNDHTPFTDD